MTPCGTCCTSLPTHVARASSLEEIVTTKKPQQEIETSRNIRRKRLFRVFLHLQRGLLVSLRGVSCSELRPPVAATLAAVSDTYGIQRLR